MNYMLKIGGEAGLKASGFAEGVAEDVGYPAVAVVDANDGLGGGPPTEGGNDGYKMVGDIFAGLFEAANVPVDIFEAAGGIDD